MRYPSPKPARRSCCRCTNGCSATAIRSPSRGPLPARLATGGRCSPTRPTSWNTRAEVSRSTPVPSARSLPELRELGQTRAGWLVGSQFVFSQHCKSCRALGYSEEKIEALKAWQVSDLFSPLERALLAYTDALVLGFGRVDDAVFAAMHEYLSDEAILEFTYITMMYTMHAVISARCTSSTTSETTRSSRSPHPPVTHAENLGRQIGYDDE